MAVTDPNAKAADSAADEKNFMVSLPNAAASPGRLGAYLARRATRSERGAQSRPAKIARDSRGRGEYYRLSSTSVSGRSLPAAVSVCHLPSAVSYSIASVRPGTRCSAAARLAAARAAAWVGKASENTPLTV